MHTFELQKEDDVELMSYLISSTTNPNQTLSASVKQKLMCSLNLYTRRNIAYVATDCLISSQKPNTFHTFSLVMMYMNVMMCSLVIHPSHRALKLKQEVSIPS